MTLRSHKHDQLDELLSKHEADSAWFATPPGFAWVTGGGDNVVSLEGETGLAAVGYDGEEITVVVDHIEADRIRDEEVFVDATYHTFDWYEQSVVAIVDDLIEGRAIADFNGTDATTLTKPERAFPLTDSELERYKRLCRDTAQVIENVARDVTPVMTEQGAAADIAHGLRNRGIAPLVVLVGGEERGRRYRHFTPSDDTLGECAKLTALGRRGGQYTAVTRTVAFNSPSALLDRYRRTQRIAATALRATQVVGRRGGTASDVFADIQAAYADVGHPDEWHAHHQGGMIGYRGREWFATPNCEATVQLGRPYAWNPSIDEAKVEDTALVTHDAVEVLTTGEDWPTTDVTPVGGGDPVELHDVYVR